MKNTSKHKTAQKTASLLSKAMEKHNKGDLSEARKIYKNIINIDPNHTDAHYLLGTAHLQAAQYQDAHIHLNRANELAPDSSMVNNNLGVTFKNIGQTNAAKLCFEKAATLDASNVDAYINLGTLAYESGEYSTAIKHFNRAISINATAIGHLNLANCYREIHDFRLAELNYLDAIKLNYELIDAHNGLAIVYREMGEWERSFQTLSNTLLINGDQNVTHWNIGLHQLYIGDYNNGWRGYEYGCLLSPPIRELPINTDKHWQGQPLESKSILIYGEQGIGDLIMFASCLPDIVSSAQDVYISCDTRLHPVLNNSFTKLTIIDCHDRDSLKNVADSQIIDYCIPIGSLPHFVRNSPSCFPSTQQYLYCNKNKYDRWTDRYEKIGSTPRIGISWRGGKTNFDKKQRSTSLTDWAELLTNLNCTYINLQYGECCDEIEDIYSSNNIRVISWGDSDPLTDLDDFFSQVAALDLVITIDNATAHIAGSLGIPTILLLPNIPDWRWRNEGEDTLWYKSVKLVRKKNSQSWPDLISSVDKLAQKMISLPKHSPHASDLMSADISKNANYKSPESNRLHTDIIYNSTLTHNPNNTTLTCAIITPVGPGHSDILNQCRQSIEKACSISHGKFNQILQITIDDTSGEIGRSMARNMAIMDAHKKEIDWLFFLDADDIMAPNAFEIASFLIDDFDAIWGKICSFDHLTNQVDDRSGQISETTSINSIVVNDPYNTLQMGHFVKTAIAADNLFNVDLNCGEDFDYYLRIWKNYKCIRTDALLFINRRGLHSTGPKSADGDQWRKSVEMQLSNYCITNNLTTEFSKYGTNVRFTITNPFDLIQRELMHGDFFEIVELEYLRDHIKHGATIVEVGANIGNHAIYYSKYMAPEKIIVIEPNPAAIKILLTNIDLNNAQHIDTNHLGIGLGATKGSYSIIDVNNNLGACNLKYDTTGSINVLPLDNIIHTPVDFIKIDVENMEIDVLNGCAKTINKYRPAILIEIMNENTNQFLKLVDQFNYSTQHIFKNINASNYFITPN